MSTVPTARPSAETYELEDLAEQAWSGKIRVPRFQRDFRWTRKDVVRLFDSIVKGYPIGSLLLWVRSAPAGSIRLGALSISAPETTEALWVVDGQQRITSLANALHESVDDPRFALAYDFESGAFVPRPVQERGAVVPLPTIFDLQRLLAWFADHPEAREHFDRATDLAKTLRQYRVPAYEVKQADETVLRAIFDRMNNYGKRLSRAEVFSALHASGETSDERLDLGSISRSIDVGTSFGRIDDDTVLQAILARRGPDVMREIRTEFEDRQGRQGFDEFPGEDRDTAYRRGQDALLDAIRFLQREAGVPHLSFLPYRYLLVVLARLFAHHPDVGVRNRILLRRWFWRAALAGPVLSKGSTTGTARALCDRIRPGDADASVHALLDTVESSKPTAGSAFAPDLDRFRTNHATTKVVLAGWWSRGPRSPWTGEPYTIVELSTVLEGQATPADAVPEILDRRRLPGDQRMWAANRVLLPEPGGTLDELDGVLASPSLPLEEREGASHEDVLDSHGMSVRVAGLLAAGDVDAFLKMRQEELGHQLEDFLTRVCEWDQEDTPSLDGLVVEDLVEDPPEQEG